MWVMNMFNMSKLLGGKKMDVSSKQEERLENVMDSGKSVSPTPAQVASFYGGSNAFEKLKAKKAMVKHKLGL